MEKILIVSGTRKGADTLAGFFTSFGYSCEINSGSDAGDVRRHLLEHHYDLVVINCPLADESGAELAVFFNTFHLPTN